MAQAGEGNCLHPIARGFPLPPSFRSIGRMTRLPNSVSGAYRPFPRFPPVPALGSASGCPALFVGFTATVAECDFSRLFVAGYGSSPSRHGGEAARPDARSPGSLNTETLRTCQGLRPRRGPDCLPPTPTFKSSPLPVTDFSFRTRGATDGGPDNWSSSAEATGIAGGVGRDAINPKSRLN
jgi:hypothetical protein